MITATIRHGNSGQSTLHRGRSIENIVRRVFGRRVGIGIRRSADPNSPDWGQVVEVVRRKWTTGSPSYLPVTYVLGTIVAVQADEKMRRAL